MSELFKAYIETFLNQSDVELGIEPQMLRLKNSHGEIVKFLMTPEEMPLDLCMVKVGQLNSRGQLRDYASFVFTSLELADIVTKIHALHDKQLEHDFHILNEKEDWVILDEFKRIIYGSDNLEVSYVMNDYEIFNTRGECPLAIIEQQHGNCSLKVTITTQDLEEANFLGGFRACLQYATPECSEGRFMFMVPFYRLSEIPLLSEYAPALNEGSQAELFHDNDLEHFEGKMCELSALAHAIHLEQTLSHGSRIAKPKL